LSACRNRFSEIQRFPLDEILVHDRDLPGRAAEADEAELQPVAKRSPKPTARGAGSISRIFSVSMAVLG